MQLGSQCHSWTDGIPSRRRKFRCSVPVPSRCTISSWEASTCSIHCWHCIVSRYGQKKWYHRLMWHFFDLSLVQSWLMYRREAAANNEPVQLPLLQFKLNVAQSLLSENKAKGVKRGRPSRDVTWMKATVRKQPEVQQVHFLSQRFTPMVLHTGLSLQQRKAAVNYLDATVFPKSDVKNVTFTFVSPQSATVSRVSISNAVIDVISCGL